MADESSDDQNFSGLQQGGGWPHARQIHRAGDLKFSSGWVIQFGGAIKILISPHPSSDQHFSILQ
jgi:hypothetical protein